MAFSGDPGKSLITSTATDTYSGRLAIDSIHWAEAVAAGDAVVVKDSLGTIIFQAKASAANVDVLKNFQDGLFVDGLNVATLGSGTLIFAMR